MLPQAQITPPPTHPHFPRQTYDPNDPYSYGPLLSSLEAALSSMYPDLYSSYSYDYYSALSSILSDYSSLYPYSYSIPAYSYPGLSATRTAAPKVPATTSGNPNPTAIGTENNNKSGGNGGGLSTGEKIGIGVGVPLAVFLLVGIGILIWCAGKRKGKKTSTTIVQPPQQQPVQAQATMGYALNQGFIQGYPQQQQVPPPQYVQQPGVQPGMGTEGYGSYGKGPQPGVVEMEQEYHFARPGVVEMGGGEVRK
ncbi:hypothetical protein K469DRAFT_682657 [Zopfia rhizophila CBS 207.26]|uniref:Mid2 domain-containing protein n=1 Tax=Zopfia rhizophila CBS 207.26 TaxID=1314779 RepID=A0A6A6D9P7_9PEZI|nr:hypothetical protein K469DRAFT_682657 [Zopfia rhizophila CBS 207.26]